MGRWWLGLALLLAAPRVGASDPGPTEGGGTAARTYFQARIGASSGDKNGRPQVCVEVAPHRKVSLQGCGTGAGIWHRDPSPEIAHFRADWHLFAVPLAGGAFEPLVGLGFAELQVGNDAPGFSFGGTGPTKVETAGPEAVVSGRWTRPLVNGLAFIADVHFGAAYFAHAPELAVPRPRLHVFLGLGAGMGF